MELSREESVFFATLENETTPIGRRGCLTEEIWRDLLMDIFYLHYIPCLISSQQLSGEIS
jgi:hypothetical protein